MGLTNAERQRRWSLKHKAKSFDHLWQLQQLARTTRNRQGGHRGWPSDMSDEEASQSGADDAASTYCEPTEGYQQQHKTTRATTTSSAYRVPQLQREEWCESQWVHKCPEGYDDEDELKPAMGRSPEKREKDALRYSTLCV
jgi:hypothetical protein